MTKGAVVGHPEDAVVCGACGGPVKGAGIRAGPKFWHRDHFVCCECGLELRSQNACRPVFQKQGLLFCEDDFRRKFVPKCAFCEDFITKDCIKALDQSWHPEHFACNKCNALFGPGQGFHELKNPHEVGESGRGRPYCRQCYIELTCSKCAKCSHPITDQAVRALDKDWHVSCFVCKECRSSFAGKTNFYCVDGDPICASCAKAGDNEKIAQPSMN